MSIGGSGYYPAGAEFDPNAPWNEIGQPEIDVEADVTITIHKKVKLFTTDYEKDEDGCITEIGDLKEEAKDQVELPKGWELLDMEVELL